MSESTRLWWLLIPPGASLVTHAVRLTRAPRSSCCAPHPSLSSRQAHATPTHRLGFPFPPFPISLSLSRLPLPPSRNATRHASGDTRGPTQVMHGPPYIFDPLFGLFFPTGSNVRCLSCPRQLLPLLLPSALSPRVVARWKDHDCPRLSFALSGSLPFSPFLILAVCNTPWFRTNILGAHQ